MIECNAFQNGKEVGPNSDHSKKVALDLARHCTNVVLIAHLAY